MNRKIFLTAGTTLLFSVALFMVYGIVEKLTTKVDRQRRIQSLPIAAPIHSMDSVSLRLPINKNLILVFFNSSCEHCQYELNEIKRNISKFKDINLFLMSSENIIDIKAAGQFYGLNEYKNIHFVKINSEDIFTSFGQLSVPHIFIYESGGNLIKEFKGETKISAILKYLP